MSEDTDCPYEKFAKAFFHELLHTEEGIKLCKGMGAMMGARSEIYDGALKRVYGLPADTDETPQEIADRHMKKLEEKV